MGFFSKQKCTICGKEGRLLGEYASATGTKCLCHDCECKMNISGFTLANSKFHNRVSYEAIQNYQKYYWKITNDLKNLAMNETKIATNLDDIVFNNTVICFPEYDKLVIETKDVFAVAFTDLPKYSGLTTDAFMISLFTVNPAIPYYSFIVAGKASFFSISGKAKKYREATAELLTLSFPCLRYPIGKAKDIKKLVKKDDNYNLPVDKKTLKDWLDSADLSMGDFNPKNVDRKIQPNNWAINFFIECGFKVV